MHCPCCGKPVADHSAGPTLERLSRRVPRVYSAGGSWLFPVIDTQIGVLLSTSIFYLQWDPVDGSHNGLVFGIEAPSRAEGHPVNFDGGALGRADWKLVRP